MECSDTGQGTGAHSFAVGLNQACIKLLLFLNFCFHCKVQYFMCALMCWICQSCPCFIFVDDIGAMGESLGQAWSQVPEEEKDVYKQKAKDTMKM